MTDKLLIEIDGQAKAALVALNEVAAGIVKLQAMTATANAAGAAGAKAHASALSDLWMAYRTAPTAGAFLKDVGVIAAQTGSTLQAKLAMGATAAGLAVRQHLVDGVKHAVMSLNSLDNVIFNVGASLLKSFGPLMGITAGLAIGIGIEQAISSTIRWDDQVARLSRTLNGNVEAASTWMAVANFVGIDADRLFTAFQRLSVSVIQHSDNLNDMGVAVVGSNGKLRQTTDILADLQRWFQAHRNSIEAVNAATTLFGRGNADMAALMGISAQEMAVLTTEARHLGLIIGNEQLAHWRAFDAEVKTAGFSVQALQLALGHGLMPIFSILAQAIAEFVSVHLKDLINGLASVVAFFTGFFGKLFGIHFEFDQFAAAIGDVSNRVAELGGVQDLAGQSTKNAANATRDATNAIDDQVAALRAQNDQFDRQIDAQIQILQQQGQQAAYEDRKKAAQQKLVADQKAIDKARSDYAQYLLIGDFANAQRVYEQLLQAQQDLENDTAALAKDESDHERQQTIDALNQKKKAHDDETNNLIAQLEKRKQAITRSSQDANASVLAGAASTSRSFNDMWNSAGKDFAAGMKKSAVEAGAGMAEKIQGAMDYIMKLINPTNDPKKVAEQKAAWDKLGKVIGDALGNAFGKAFWDSFTRNIPVVGGAYIILSQMVAALPAAAQNVAKGAQYQAGGTVPGPYGMPTLIVAHGGEQITNNHQVSPSREAGGAMHVVQHIYGSTDTEAVAEKVVQKLRFAFGRK